MTSTAASPPLPRQRLAGAGAGAGAGTTDSARRYARGSAIAVILVAASWHVVNSLVTTLADWRIFRFPQLVGLSWLIVAAVLVTSAVGVLRGGTRRRTRRPDAVAVLGIVVLLATTAAVIVGAGEENRFIPGNWAWASFGWQAMLVLWRVPMRWLLCALGANAVVTLIAMLAVGPVDRLDLSRFAVTTYGAVAIQVGVRGGCRFLERLAARAATAVTAREHSATLRLAADRVHVDRQRRYAEVGQAVRRLLTDLANDRLDPAEEMSRRRCAVEAARLRRLIAERDDVPSPLLHELRACADVAERRGVAVTLETVGTPPTLALETRRALTEAPMHVLASARTQARVTIFVEPAWAELARAGAGLPATDGAVGGAVEVSVVADADPSAVEPAIVGTTGGRVEVRWSREGGTVWVRTMLHTG
jgi:hypothetical protein